MIPAPGNNSEKGHPGKGVPVGCEDLVRRYGGLARTPVPIINPLLWTTGSLRYYDCPRPWPLARYHRRHLLGACTDRRGGFGSGDSLAAAAEELRD